jgi:hypothetical protein
MKVYFVRLSVGLLLTTVAGVAIAGEAGDSGDYQMWMSMTATGTEPWKPGSTALASS